MKNATVFRAIFGLTLLAMVMVFTPFRNYATYGNGQAGCEPYSRWCRKDAECAKLRGEARGSCRAGNPYPKGKKPDNCPSCTTPQ